jgi:hypothetical protein
VFCKWDKHLADRSEPFMSASGHERKCSRRAEHFRSSPNNGHRSARLACPFRAMNGLMRRTKIETQTQALEILCQAMGGPLAAVSFGRGTDRTPSEAPIA